MNNPSPLEAIRAKWKDHPAVRAAAGELTNMEDDLARLREAEDPEERKAYRLLWQRAAHQYWELAWSLVEARIDAEKLPPEALTFDDAEKLAINFGVLSSKVNVPNPHFADELDQPACLDIYQYGRLTDFLAENYALLFGKPYEGPQGGTTREEKLARFASDLGATEQRRRLVVSMVLSRCGFITPPEVEEMLSHLEAHLRIHTEVEMRTRRVREADPSDREKIHENSKRYELAEHELLISLERAAKEIETFSDPELQKVLGLHDRTRFLANLEVHVRNEAERWKTRVEMAARKHKGKGVPALKGELREAFNHKKEFMTLAARSARMDTSPLNVDTGKPVGFKQAGEIMMDLTPLDPDMLRAPRVRMYGIPKVILTPGRGLGVYDWTDNSLLIPQFSPYGGVLKSFCFALGAFRWDNDEDRVLKDSYGLIKENRDKGIRALQESFCQDYFIWMSKERRGYRVLPKETSKWFRVHFKKPA